MKKTGVLNQDISEVIAGMGHGDMLVVSDAGLAIPDCVWRIDVAVKPGLPTVLDLLKVIREELQVESIVIPDHLKDHCPDLLSELKKLYPDAKINEVPTETYKEKAYQSKAIIRTGECTPYANVILVSGVIF